MRVETALGVLIDIAMRIFGLCIVIAENTVHISRKKQRRYIEEQRSVMRFIQDDLNLYSMLNELYDEED